MQPPKPMPRHRRLRAVATAGALAATLVAGLTGLLPLGAVLAQEDRGEQFRAVAAPEPLVLRGSDRNTPSTVRPTRAFLRASAEGQPTSTFEVTYTGFNTEQRTAFQRAVDIWSNIVVSSVPIRVDAQLSSLPAGVLGSAGPGAAYQSSNNNTLYVAALANAISGRDISQGRTPDILADFTNDPNLFYYGNDAVPQGQFDFTTVVLHEIGHGLGFLNGLEVVTDENGAVVGTYGTDTTPSPFIYDRFIVQQQPDGSVINVVDSYRRESPELADALQDGQPTGNSFEQEPLLWDGASAVSAAGGSRPLLFAPPTFSQGSSIGHLDEGTYRPGNRNALMTPVLDRQEVARDPGPISIGILEDQGWGISSAADPTPPSSSPSPSPSATATATASASPSASPSPSFASSPSPSPTPPPSTGSRYTGLSPSRILDTRSGLGTGVARRVGPGGTLDLGVDGRAGVPTNATAVVLNITGVGASASTDVRAYPATGSGGFPTVSNLNLPAGGTRANLVTVPVGPGGAVRLRNQSGTVHLLADVAGFYAPNAAAAFFPLDPERLLDTRSGLGTGGRIFKLGGGQTLDLRVAGTRSVPRTAQAVVLNVTASGATVPSDVRVYPTRLGNPGFPDVSNLNVRPGGPVPNLVIARVGDDGLVRLRNNSGRVSLLADVFGYYEQSSGGALFRPVTPTRLLDSRPGRLGAAQVLDVDTDARGPVPSGATAVALNVTGVGASVSTDLRAYPSPLSSTTRPPSVSTLNLVRGQTAAAAAIVRTGDGQAVRIYNNSGTVAVLADVAGWFGPA